MREEDVGTAKGRKGGSRPIKAAVLRRKGGPLGFEWLEIEGPRDDEILVRLAATGICHTDIRYIDDWEESDGPLVLGHEGAGVVVETGPHAGGFRPGDHVVLTFQSCGRCPPCLEGRPAHCDNFYQANFGFQRLDGSHALSPGGVRGHFFGQSSFATFALSTERNTVRVAPDLPLETLAPLGCGVQTGAGTILNSLRVSPGKSVVVLGSGAVGLSAILAAAMAGARPIVAVDIRRSRLGLARELGASHALDARDSNVATGLSAITSGGVDYVLETSGAPEMERLARAILNPGGVAAMIANPAGNESLPGGRRIVEIIQGDSVPQLFIPRLIDLWQKGRFPFHRLIKRYEFQEINRAISDARRGRAAKPVLRMPYRAPA